MSDDRDDFKHEVKAAYDRLGPREALARIDGTRKTKPQGGDAVSTLCLWHTEQNPSLSVHRGGSDGGIAIKCHACGVSGDVFTLVAGVHGLDVRNDFARVLEIAGELVGLRPDGPRPTSPPRPPAPKSPTGGSNGSGGRDMPSPDEVRRIWEHELRAPIDADAWEYLHGRGLDEASSFCRAVPEGGVTVRTKDGSRPMLRGLRIAVPLFNAQGQMVAIQARDFTGGKEHTFRVVGPSKAGVFGAPERLAEPAVEWVILVEGLTDYLAALAAIRPENPRAIVLGVAGVENAEHFKALPLAGKRVVIASDADAAGDAFAAEIVAAVAPRGARCFRARPTFGKDLCDMITAGQDLAAFLRRPRPIRRHRPNVLEVDFATDLRGERDERLAERGRALTFGVEYLDRLFGRLMPNDIVLVGSKTGVGKTELLTAVAAANAVRGRRVRYFALEAERREITRRLKWRELANAGYPAAAEAGLVPNYLDWRQADPDLDAVLAPLEPAIDQRLLERIGRNLVVLYRMGGFTIEDFVTIAEDTETETDLYILDHLHYIDNADESENRGLTRILQAISDLALRLAKPIVIAAHLRKEPPTKQKRLLPSLDDFQGTSNISKIVTKALMMGRADDQKPQAPWLAPTYMQAQKLRRDGSRCRFVGLVHFSMKTGRYVDEFQVGLPKGEKFEPLKIDEWPHWATRRMPAEAGPESVH